MRNQQIEKHTAKELSEATEARQFCATLVIANAEDLQFAAEVLSDVKARNKSLEDMKQSALGPLNQTVKTIRGWFQPVQSLYVEMESTIKNKIVAYHQDLERKRVDALAAVRDSLTHGTTEDTTVALAFVDQAQKPSVAGIQMRRTWDYEVYEMNDVPEKYLYRSIDEEQLLRDIRDGMRECPGIRIFQKETVAAMKAEQKKQRLDS